MAALIELSEAAQSRGTRTGWRALARADDVPALVTRFARAQDDAVRARASLERLITLCRPVAEEIARAYARRDADVADLVQEALLLLTRDLPKLREPMAFPQWFASVTRNVCRHWLRHERARWTELSLDAPPRPGWLETAEEDEPLDVPDPDAARDFLGLETDDRLRSLLRTLPEQQRTALTLAYVADHSHEQIGQALDISPRAAEGLVYRALRRLQAIAAQFAEEPQEIAVWCPHCGQRRLIAQILPGFDPRAPLWRRWQCPGCHLASAWAESNAVPLARYPSLDAAWWHERVQWAPHARSLARGRDLRCWKCGAPLHRRDRLADTGTADGLPLYVLHWSCFNCDVGTFCGPFFAVAAGLLPEALAFWRSTPHLLMEPERLVRTAGEEQVVLTAHDPDSGRRATLAVARETLEVRRFEVEGR